MSQDRIKNFGAARQTGATEANKPGQFVKGRSGNPGGKPKIANILAAIGKTTDEARVELVRTAWEWMQDPDASDKSRTYAHKFLSDMVGLIFKQQIEVTGNVSPEAQALLEALKMTPHERRLAEAQDTTAGDASDDDTALAELVEGDVESGA